MKLEEQVTSLELSKRLKELGVKRDSLFVWFVPSSKQYYALGYCPKMARLNGEIPAYTVAELGLMMPNNCGTMRDFDYGFMVYTYQKNDDGRIVLNHYHTQQTEADARADMIIYLIENNIIKPE